MAAMMAARTITKLFFMKNDIFLLVRILFSAAKVVQKSISRGFQVRFSQKVARTGPDIGHLSSTFTLFSGELRFFWV
jgi:hypothetical protein